MGLRAARRARYSVFLWPSLYSLRTILLTPLIFAALAGLTALMFHLYREKDRPQIARAQERTRAIMGLKLSGAAAWQWKRELTCENQRGDCLKIEISFLPPERPFYFGEKIIAPKACKICHGKDAEHDLAFYTSFPGIPKDSLNRITEWLLLSLITACGIALLIRLLVLRRRRAKSGICVAAFEVSDASDKALGGFLERLFASPTLAYYAEAQGSRVRIVTLAEKFDAILEANRALFAENKSAVRCIALYADPEKNSRLPIELLRSSFQFLGKISPGQNLVQEKLAEQLGIEPENGRRLVFKNKSGALLRFVVWEA